MNFFSLIPLPYKLAIGAAIIIALWAGYGLWRHGIYKEGEEACQAAYASAAKKADETAHVKINKLEATYEDHKKAVYTVAGDNPRSGRRVSAAIDRMPEPADSRK